MGCHAMHSVRRGCTSWCSAPAAAVCLSRRHRARVCARAHSTPPPPLICADAPGSPSTACSVMLDPVSTAYCLPHGENCAAGGVLSGCGGTCERPGCAPPPPTCTASGSAPSFNVKVHRPLARLHSRKHLSLQQGGQESAAQCRRRPPTAQQPTRLPCHADRQQPRGVHADAGHLPLVSTQRLHALPAAASVPDATGMHVQVCVWRGGWGGWGCRGGAEGAAGTRARA